MLNDWASSTSAGIDRNDNLRFEWELSLWKLDVPGAASPSPGSSVLRDEGGRDGAAEILGLSVLRLNANFVLGTDAERTSSKACSNELICCRHLGWNPLNWFYEWYMGTHFSALSLIICR